MKPSPQRILLQAQLVSFPGVSKQVCVAHVIVGQGALHSCAITGATDGLLLQQREVYEALARYGDVDWLVLPAPPIAAITVGQRVTKALERRTLYAGNVPLLRVSPLSREILTQFPYGLRIALVLVDGKRSLATIAHLLHKTPHDIQQIFEQLPDLVQL